jgi:hypothetical protein
MNPCGKDLLTASNVHTTAHYFMPSQFCKRCIIITGDSKVTPHTKDHAQEKQEEVDTLALAARIYPLTTLLRDMY